LSSEGSRASEEQVRETRAVLSDQIAAGGLVDISSLTLRDLREMRDADDESCLGRALSRVLASTEGEGHHGFQSSI
jgi:hypothetical protein